MASSTSLDQAELEFGSVLEKEPTYSLHRWCRENLERYHYASLPSFYLSLKTRLLKREGHLPPTYKKNKPVTGQRRAKLLNKYGVKNATVNS